MLISLPFKKLDSDSNFLWYFPSAACFVRSIHPIVATSAFDIFCDENLRCCLWSKSKVLPRLKSGSLEHSWVQERLGKIVWQGAGAKQSGYGSKSGKKNLQEKSWSTWCEGYSDSPTESYIYPFMIFWCDPVTDYIALTAESKMHLRNLTFIFKPPTSPS